MSLPTAFLTTTFDLYRPFGSPTPVATGIACRLVPDFAYGRGTGPASGTLIFSHYMDVDDSVDIRDGCTRTAGVDAASYADGDQVFIPDSSGSSYVVVWVEVRGRGTTGQFKRAYLLRDSPAWPGP